MLSRKISFSALKTMTLSLLMVCILSGTACAATSITLWTTEVGPDRQAVINYLAQAFMIFNPEIEIHIKGVEENKIANALNQACRSNEIPDIISCASDLIVAFSNQGWMNCNGTGKVLSSIGKDNFFPGALSKLRLTNGRYCGLPYNGWVQGIWYRRDWFEEKGLEPPNSWDNILKAARVFHSPEKGRYGILIGTRKDAYAEQVFTHLALSAGVKEFSQDGDVCFNSPETVKTLKFYKELARYSPRSPVVERQGFLSSGQAGHDVLLHFYHG